MRNDSIGYVHSAAHLLAELERIGSILNRYDTVDYDITETSEDQPPTTETTGKPRQLPLALSDSARETARSTADRIAKRCRQTDDETTLRLSVLAENFDLSRRHLDVLMLALAPRLDASYHNAFQHVHGRTLLTKPTPLLVGDLFSRTPAQRLTARGLVGTASPLRQHDLLRLDPCPDSGLGEQCRLLSVDDHVVEYLCGDDGVDPDLEAALQDHGGEAAFTRREADTSLADLTVEADLRETLRPLADATDPQRCYWYGPAGTEKHRAVAAVSGADSYLQADLRAVLAADALDRLYREVALLDCPPVLTNATAAIEASPRHTLGGVFDSFGDLDVDLFVTGTESWTPTGTMATEIDAIVEFPYPSIALRRQFWERHADTLPPEVDPEQLAGTFRLTQGELGAALATARSLAGDDALSAADIYDGCSAQSAAGLDDLAQHIDPSNTWDDIQLPADTMEQLRILQSHITNQARIYSQWGFAEQFSRGIGVVALFSGPSGTGKTMAAEIIGNDVGMDLYRIDLSSVVSKYIGETEENLEEIFTAAENSNAILLFDEADAVFGDRAEVSDATDRYANVEVNYLLQRIETYDGVVLLTTNNEGNIDQAFTRRIDHTVSFARPKEDTRTAIWRGIFPEDTPLGEIDYGFLSGFEFAGGQIRTIGQTAAILAARDDSAVEMKHVVRAMQLEADKDGRMLNPSEFGDYRQFLSLSTAAGDDEQPVQDDDTRATQPPEAVVRDFFDALAAAAGDEAHGLYHSESMAETFSIKQLKQMARGNISIVSDLQRVREDPQRVVLQFTQELNDNRERLEYDLRLEDNSWRIFNIERATDSTVDLGR